MLIFNQLQVKRSRAKDKINDKVLDEIIMVSMREAARKWLRAVLLCSHLGGFPIWTGRFFSSFSGLASILRVKMVFPDTSSAKQIKTIKGDIKGDPYRTKRAYRARVEGRHAGLKPESHFFQKKGKMYTFNWDVTVYNDESPPEAYADTNDENQTKIPDTPWKIMETYRPVYENELDNQLNMRLQQHMHRIVNLEDVPF